MIDELYKSVRLGQKAGQKSTFSRFNNKQTNLLQAISLEGAGHRGVTVGSSVSSGVVGSSVGDSVGDFVGVSVGDSVTISVSIRMEPAATMLPSPEIER